MAHSKASAPANAPNDVGGDTSINVLPGLRAALPYLRIAALLPIAVWVVRMPLTLVQPNQIPVEVGGIPVMPRANFVRAKLTFQRAGDMRVSRFNLAAMR